MHDVTQRRRRQAAVRVTCQNRPAGRRLSGRDHPGVAAFKFVGAVYRRHVHRDFHRTLARGALSVATPHQHALCGQLEYARCFRRDAGVQALGNFCLPWRGWQGPYFIRFEIVAAGRNRPRKFRAEIARQAVAANPHHVFRLPLLGCIAKMTELKGQSCRVTADVIDVGVDTCDKARGDALGIPAVYPPLFLHIAAIQKQARRTILLDKIRAKHRGEFSQAATTPQVDLKQAITGGIEPLCEKHIVFTTRINVRHAPGIDENLRWGRQAGNRDALRFPRLGRGLCKLRIGWRRTENDKHKYQVGQVRFNFQTPCSCKRCLACAAGFRTSSCNDTA